MYSDFGQIDVTLKDQVFLIEIAGLDRKTHASLSKVFRAAHESDARVVVVTGKGRTFLNPQMFDWEWVSKLTDFNYMLGITREAEDIFRDQINVDKPMIAKVYAPGAHSLGASIALACDFVIASEDATFSDPHVSGMGLPPGDGGALLWPIRIGLGRAKEFLMTPKECTAREAVDIGLINRAVPADQLDAEVDKLIATLLAQPHFGLRMTKKWLNQYLQHQLTLVGLGAITAESLVMASDEFKESLRAMSRMVEEQKNSTR